MKYQIGPWVFTPQHCLLESNGVTKELEPLLFKLLQHFVANADRIIPRQELVENVWQANFVDDNAINRAISDLRKQLSHSEFDGSFVKTHYRKGYSLAVTPNSILEGQHKSPTGSKSLGGASSINPNKVIQGFLFVVVAAGFLWQLLLHLDSKPQSSNDTSTPLNLSAPAEYSFEKVPATWQSGRESYQAVSPDRSLFVYTNFYDDMTRVFVKKLGANLQTEVRYQDYQLTSLSWQPDSQFFLVEMLNDKRKECFYASFDASHFPEVKFVNVIKSCDVEAQGMAQLNALGTGMYYIDLDQSGAGHELYYFDILTQNTRLTLPSFQIPIGIREFALSPNGNKILYKRDEQGQSSRFFVHDISLREDTKLLEIEDYIDAISLDWIDDTWVLILSTGAITKININTLEKERIEFPDAHLFGNISVINQNQILGAERFDKVLEISAVDDLYDGKEGAVNYQSDGHNYFPTFIGSRLFFVSTRSGGSQYWKEEDGSLLPVTQLSSNKRNIPYPPSGTIDGSILLFRNHQSLMLLDLQTNLIKSLTGIEGEFVNTYEIAEDKTTLYLAYTNNQVIQLWEYDLSTDIVSPVLNESIEHLIKDSTGNIYYIKNDHLIGLTKEYQLDLPFDARFCICAAAMSNRYLYVIKDKKTIYRIELTSGKFETQTYSEPLTGITVSPDDNTVIVSKVEYRDTQIFRLSWQPNPP